MTIDNTNLRVHGQRIIGNGISILVVSNNYHLANRTNAFLNQDGHDSRAFKSIQQTRDNRTLLLVDLVDKHPDLKEVLQQYGNSTIAYFSNMITPKEQTALTCPNEGIIKANQKIYPIGSLTHESRLSEIVHDYESKKYN